MQLILIKVNSTPPPDQEKRPTPRPRGYDIYNRTLYQREAPSAETLPTGPRPVQLRRTASSHPADRHHHAPGLPLMPGRAKDRSEIETDTGRPSQEQIGRSVEV